jgi:hypothetical protein
MKRNRIYFLTLQIEYSYYFNNILICKRIINCGFLQFIFMLMLCLSEIATAFHIITSTQIHTDVLKLLGFLLSTGRTGLVYRCGIRECNTSIAGTCVVFIILLQTIINNTEEKEHFLVRN